MPFDPASALFDQITQSLAKVIWDCPELSFIRGCIETFLESCEFRALIVTLNYEQAIDFE